MLTLVNHFSDWLVKQLEERGWTQTELANRSRLSRSAVSLLISGQRNPAAETCLAIARALSLPPETVLMAADLLPESVAAERDPTFQEILNVVKHMTLEERAELLDYALFRFRRQKK